MKPKKQVAMEELAKASGWSRKTVIAYLKKYQEMESGEFDRYDIQSVFTFYRYLLKKREEKIEALKVE